METEAQNVGQSAIEVVKGRLVAPSPLVLTTEICARCGVNIVDGPRFEDRVRRYFAPWAMIPLFLVLVFDWLAADLPAPWGSALLIGTIALTGILNLVIMKKSRVSYSLCGACESRRKRLFGLAGVALVVLPVIIYAGFKTSAALIAVASLIILAAISGILWLRASPLIPAGYDSETERFTFMGMKKGAANRLARASDS